MQCLLPHCRLLDFVEDVLNVVEVIPDNPFEFAAPQFGVRVEDPPEYLGEEETFAPNITALLSQIKSSTAKNMQQEEIPELPPAMVTLNSTLLSPDDTGSKPRVSTSVFASGALFQQRSNREREKVGSIVVDLSLRLGGKVKNVNHPNSNVVKPTFTKSTVSISPLHTSQCGKTTDMELIQCIVVSPFVLTLYIHSVYVHVFFNMQLAKDKRSNATCRFWNFTADGEHF